MPVSGDSHGGGMTHSPVVGLLDIWDATHHVFCAVQPQETCYTASQWALSSLIYGCNGAAGVASP